MYDNHGASHQWKMHTASHPYAALALNMVLSLVVMYLVMFSMIDGWSDFRNNINMVYMVLTMVAPMGILMLVMMGGMYQNKRLNFFLFAGLALLFVAALTGTRNQTLVGDRQFIASMIPHHSGAILMCRKSAITDPELLTLCSEISRGQRHEIDQMNAIEKRLRAEIGGAPR